MSKIPSFFTKIAIAWPRMIQIPKFWCLKSCTNIWPSFRNIYSVPKVIKIYSEGRKGAKPAKICTFFTLQKIKIAFSQKFPKVWFDGFFLWLRTYETFHISLTNILKQDRCDWRDARVAWYVLTSEAGSDHHQDQQFHQECLENTSHKMCTCQRRG